MNTKVLSFLATALLATASWLPAEEPAAAAKPSSPEFARLKTLVGSWQGKADMGQGPVDMTVRYRLIAAGSVLEERVFEGTPNEMVTMYYEKDGKVALTHYCMLGNRPAMTLGASDEKTLKFDFDGSSCCIKADKETHMHALTIRFDNADQITTGCVGMAEGKKSPEHGTTLHRVKGATTTAN